jgi:hypothetical protein
MEVTLTSAATRRILFEGEFPCLQDEQGRVGVSLEIPLPSVDLPEQMELEVHWKNKSSQASNNWTLWLLPDVITGNARKIPFAGGSLSFHNSVSDAYREEMGFAETISWDEVVRSQDTSVIVIARRFDADLVQWLAAGGRCLLLPDGGSLSLRIRDHWFLRGGPVLADHPLTHGPLGQMLVDLQTFDFAGPVAYDFAWLAKGTPIFSLWDNHDLTTFRTHTLLWEAGFAEGRLLVSSLDLRSVKNIPDGANDREAKAQAAGPYLLSRLLAHLSSNEFHPQPLSSDNVQQLLAETRQQQMSLSDVNWRFRRLSVAEHASTVPLQEKTDGVTWQDIEITRHWDGQGHGDWDGWGIYRANLTVPQDWRNEPLHVVTTGVDDYFELFVNGHLIGTGGNIEKRETAFELRASYEIPLVALQGEQLEIAIRVFDWQGAGGVFRPIYVSTSGLPPEKTLLEPRTMEKN